METEYIKCNLCGSDKTRLLYKKKDYGLGGYSIEWPVVRCERCGLCYVNPRPKKTQLRGLYPPKYFQAMSSQNGDERINERKARFIKRRRPGTLLDVGCGSGSFLKHMKARGWDVHGLELSPIPFKEDDCCKVLNSDLKEAAFGERTFDVITAWSVLEHMYDPASFLSEAGRVIKEDGELIILVPNIENTAARVLKSDDVPRHLYMFSKKTIGELLSRAGFRIDACFFTGGIIELGHKGLIEYYLMRMSGRNTDNFFEKMYSFDFSLERRKENLPVRFKRLGISGAACKMIDHAAGIVLDGVSLLLGNYGMMVVRAGKAHV